MDGGEEAAEETIIIYARVRIARSKGEITP